MKSKTVFEKFSDLLRKVSVFKAFIFLQSEMTEEDYEKISFSQWQEIEKETSDTYYPELNELSKKMMFKLFDPESSSFGECQKMSCKFGYGYRKEAKQLKKLMFVKARTFEDWLYIHLHFGKKKFYQDPAFETMSKLKGKLSSYIELIKKHFKDQKSRWFKLAEQKITNFDGIFDPHSYIGSDYSDFGKYIRLKALEKDIEFANHFTDWDNTRRHRLPLELKNSSYSVKCYEGMYATAGVSINYLDILYDLLIDVQGGSDIHMSKEYFEKNNSQNLKIDEMIQFVIDQMRTFIVEVKGLVSTHSNYWVKFYSIAKENKNPVDQRLVLDGLNSLKAKNDFWNGLEKYQRDCYPEIADIAIKKMKEAISLAS